MSLEEDVRQAVEDIQGASNEIVADATTMHDITHGPQTGPESTVDTDNGPVRTLSRAINEMANGADLANRSLTNLLSLITADKIDPSVTAPRILPGQVMRWDYNFLPAGYLYANGETIGNANSAAVYRSDDYEEAFNNIRMRPPNLGTEDFSNGDIIVLPDYRGLTAVGRDLMNSTAIPNVSLTVTTTIDTDATVNAVVASVTGLTIGMYVVSANVPEGTTVNSIIRTTGNAANIVLSQAALATATGTSATFSLFRNPDTVGDIAGEFSHQLNVSEIPKFTPTYTEPNAGPGLDGHRHSESTINTQGGICQSGEGTAPGNEASSINTGYQTTGLTFDELGGDVAHTNLQSSVIASYIVFVDAKAVDQLQVIGLGDQVLTFDGADQSDSDPGPGTLRFNTTDPSTTTFIYVDDETLSGESLRNFYLSYNSSTSAIKATLQVSNMSRRGDFAIYSVSEIAPRTGYVAFSVQYLDGAGTIVDRENIAIVLGRTGDKGDVSLPGLRYQWDPTTTKDDPGQGFLRANNVNTPSINRLFIDNQDVNGAAMNPEVLSWGNSSSSTKGFVRIIQSDNLSQVLQLVVTGPCVQEPGYVEVPVAFLGGTRAFTSAANISVEFTRAGDKGDVGFSYVWSTDQTATDPGQGGVKTNAAGDQIYINQETADPGNPNVAAWIESWGAIVNSLYRGVVLIRKADNPAIFLIYNIKGATVDNGGWYLSPGDLVDSAGTLQNGDTVSVSFVPAGKDGGNGPQGVPGPSIGVNFRYDTVDTVDSDPGTGRYKLSNLDPTAITAGFAYVSKTNVDGVDVSTWLASLSDSTSITKGRLHFIDPANSANLFIFKITGNVDSAPTNYVKVPIAFESGGGTLTDERVITWGFYATGDPGTPGAGTSVKLDLGNNGSFESMGIDTLAVSGDTNSIFTMPVADKLLIDLALNWPKSDESVQADLALKSLAFTSQGHNNSGGQIAIRSPVYATGYNEPDGPRTLGLAQANGTSTMPCIGLTAEAIADSAEGEIITNGFLVGVDTSAWAVNDRLYVSPTVAGGLTNTKPSSSGQLIQFIGVVFRSNVSTGIIYVLNAERTNDIPNDIPADKLTSGRFANARAPQMNENTIKLRPASSGTGDQQDGTPAQARTIIGLPFPAGSGDALKVVRSNAAGDGHELSSNGVMTDKISRFTTPPRAAITSVAVSTGTGPGGVDEFTPNLWQGPNYHLAGGGTSAGKKNLVANAGTLLNVPLNTTDSLGAATDQSFIIRGETGAAGTLGLASGWLEGAEIDIGNSLRFTLYCEAFFDANKDPEAITFTIIAVKTWTAS